MTKQSIDELLTQLDRPEYARTFADIARHSPVIIDNGTTYQLTEDGVQAGTRPADVTEYKTLYFTLQDAEGPYLGGLVLPEDDRVDWAAAAQALGTYSQAVVSADYATHQLPAAMSKGSCGPFLPDGYAHRAKIVFDQSRHWSHKDPVRAGWRLPGSPAVGVYTQGIEPVFKAASHIADAQYAAIRKV